MRRTTLLLAALSLVIPLSAVVQGCAFGSIVGSNDLPLKRVVVYRNGVGYFQREGTVRSKAVRFKVRHSHVGDFLATLAVMERGGSSVRAASFPTRTDQRTVSGSSLVDVSLELDGGSHDLQVGYVAETPVWKPSYRLVVTDGKAQLQAWGIVHNNSGEDWKDVRLSLVAGAPIAFQSTLQLPVTPRRPTITDRGEVIASVPRGVTMLDKLATGAATRPRLSRRGRRVSKKAKREAKRGGRYRYKGDADAPAELAAPEPDVAQPPAIMAPRNLAALATVAVQAGLTRYDVPHPVTVPDESATMVLLMSVDVPGELVHLFAPDPGVPDSRRHPFRVARFRNGTKGLLERGPIAIFEAASFLGQGVTQSIPTGGSATIPFALERGVAVDSQRKFDRQGARVRRIMAGVLTIERDTVTRTVYRAQNGGRDAVKLVVKHPRQSSTRLHQPPKGTEDKVGGGFAMVPFALEPRSKGTLEVEERATYTQRVGWEKTLAGNAVKQYIADPKADPTVVDALKKAWAIRTQLVAMTAKQQKLSSERATLRKASEETRNNLTALQKNKAAGDLRKKLTARLAKYSARLDDITRATVELGMRLNEQRVRFSEIIRDIKLKRAHTDKPATPPK